jgi:hypothetical protein
MPWKSFTCKTEKEIGKDIKRGVRENCCEDGRWIKLDQDGIKLQASAFD